LRFSIPEQSLEFLENPPAYTSPNILESSKEENTAEVPQVTPPNQVENNPEVTPTVQPESEKPHRELTAMSNDPVQTTPHEKPLDEKQQDSEKRGVQQDRTIQRQAPIELSTFPQRKPAVAMNHRPPQTSPTHTMRPTNWVSIPHGPAPPQPSTPQGSGGVGGWFKSLID
jgi:hypothetical protein